MLSLLLALILPLVISAQSISYMPMILNTAALPMKTTSYPIGYLPPSIINPISNASACRRVSMFKFPSSASGTASLLKINFAAQPVPEICNIGFSLFNLQNNSQIGRTFVDMFNVSTNNTVDISSSGWSFAAGSLYYLQIQTNTWNTDGMQCIAHLPYNINEPSAGGTTSQRYGIVVQQGPLNQPCGATPWTSVAALDGGYIPMQIWVSPSQSPTATATPRINGASVTGSQTPTSSETPTSSNTEYVSSSGTPSPSTTETESGSSSSTGTPTPTSVNQGQTPSLSQTPAPASTARQTYTQPQSIAETPSSSIRLSHANTGYTNGLSSGIAAGVASTTSSIVGGVIGAFMLIAAVAASILYYKNRYYIKETRSPVISTSVIVSNPVMFPQISQNKIYMQNI